MLLPAGREGSVRAFNDLPKVVDPRGREGQRFFRRKQENVAKIDYSADEFVCRVALNYACIEGFVRSIDICDRE